MGLVNIHTVQIFPNFPPPLPRNLHTPGPGPGPSPGPGPISQTAPVLLQSIFTFYFLDKVISRGRYGRGI